MKKLSSGGITDVLLYDVLKQDRNPDYYYQLLKQNHDTRADRGAYVSTQDPYLVDKVVDAIQNLGDISYSRLEGEAQVVVLLCEVLADDPSAMAQTHAANSLTKLAIKMPRYGEGLEGQMQLREERGDQFLALVQEMDGLWDESAAPRHQGAVARTTQIVTQIGNADIREAKIARDSLRPFYTRDFLVDATEPDLRRALDTALVKRMQRAVRLSLHDALENEVDHVRRESVLGIKLLNDRTALERVLARMEIEHDWQVRAEATEYFGKMGTAECVAALLPILDDEDPTLRHKSRQALTRIAGRDYGRQRADWMRWAEARFPQISERLREEEDGDAPSPRRRRDNPEPRDRELEPDIPAAPGSIDGPSSVPSPRDGRLPPIAGSVGTLPPLDGPTPIQPVGAPNVTQVPPPMGGMGDPLPPPSPSSPATSSSPYPGSSLPANPLPASQVPPPSGYGLPPGLVPSGVVPSSPANPSPTSSGNWPSSSTPSNPSGVPIPVAPYAGSVTNPQGSTQPRGPRMQGMGNVPVPGVPVPSIESLPPVPPNTRMPSSGSPNPVAPSTTPNVNPSEAPGPIELTPPPLPPLTAPAGK